MRFSQGACSEVIRVLYHYRRPPACRRADEVGSPGGELHGRVPAPDGFIWPPRSLRHDDANSATHGLEHAAPSRSAAAADSAPLVGEHRAPHRGRLRQILVAAPASSYVDGQTIIDPR